LPDINSIHYELLDSPEEFALIRQIYDFPQVIASSCSTYNIALLVNYLLEFTRIYASAYVAHPVLKAETTETRDARMALAKSCAQIIKTGMSLLGVNVPERM
jgi:arginyl-tRNA synthetase